MPTPSPQQRILVVAKAHFTERGFSNASVRDICRDARVTAPTLYYHFKNKEALFEAVVRETITMTKFVKRLNDECRKADDPESQIRAFARTYLSSFPAGPVNAGLYLRRSTKLDSVGAKTLTAELDRVQSILIDIVRRGIADGKFRNTDPRMAAECLLGMMNRFVFQRIHFRRPYGPSEAASYLSDFFLRGMKPSTELNQQGQQA